MGFLWVNTRRNSAAFNMAYDDALLQSATQKGSPVLRFYGWTEPAATFGYFQHHAEIEAMTHLRPLVRRPTGGGLVPHDADWTYSAAFPHGTEWYELRAEESYRRIHEWVRAAFAKLNVETELAPCCRKAGPGQCFEGYEKYDLLWQGRKIAGAAQRRTKQALLIQGSVQPPPIGLNRADWEQAMLAAGETTATEKFAAFKADDAFTKMVEQLAREIYSEDGYNRKR